MELKNKEILKQQAELIRKEVGEGLNTAERIGKAFNDIIENVDSTFSEAQKKLPLSITLDDMQNMTAAFARMYATASTNSPARLFVTFSNGVVGTLDLIADSIPNVLTQVFTTRMILNSQGVFNGATSTTENKICTFYRSLTLGTTGASWSAWKEQSGVTIEQEISDSTEKVPSSKAVSDAIKGTLNNKSDYKTKATYGRADLKNGYTNVGTLDIGSTFNILTLKYAGTGAGQLPIPVEPGDMVSARFYTSSNKYTNAWLILDKDRKILQWDRDGSATTVRFEHTEDPLVMTMPEEAAWFVLQFTANALSDYPDFPVVEIKIPALDELASRIEKVEGKMSGVDDEIFNLKKLIAKKTTFGNSDLKTPYTNLTGLNIGSSFMLTQTKFSGSGTAQLAIPVIEGDIISAKFYTTSNQYCNAWVILDAERKILAWDRDGSTTTVTFNHLESPLVMKMPKDAAFFVMQFNEPAMTNHPEQPEVVRMSFSEEGGGGEVVTENILIAVPDVIDAVVGDTLQLFYRCIFRCVDPYHYDINVLCDIGAQYPRYYEVTPNDSNVGDHQLTLRIRDNNGNILGEKTIKLRVSAKPKTPSKALNVLCVGASATQGGQWAGELKRRLTASDGSPVGNALGNINFVGRLDKSFNNVDVKLEGIGGYSFSSFNSVSTRFYKFFFTEDKKCGTLNVGDVYTYNGHDFTVSEINVTAGVGNISCLSDFSQDISSSSGGTLERKQGTGDMQIQFSSLSMTGNPFAFDGKVDFAKYAELYCNGQIDVVCVEALGNNASIYTEDFASRFAEMRKFIDNVRSAFPNAKICVGVPWPEDLYGGAGVNYGASGGYSLTYGIKYNRLALINKLQDYIKENGLEDYVYIINWLNEMDQEYAFVRTTKPANVRTTITELFGQNGVHPSTVGYMQIADATWRLFVAKFCQ